MSSKVYGLFYGEGGEEEFFFGVYNDLVMVFFCF